MTLIDRDKLLQKFQDKELFNVTEKHLSLIQNATAIDAVEVVHAYWKRADDWTDECSACGDWHENDINDRTPYCPNCGAKMDGLKKDVM